MFFCGEKAGLLFLVKNDASTALTKSSEFATIEIGSCLSTFLGAIFVAQINSIGRRKNKNGGFTFIYGKILWYRRLPW